MSGESKTSSEPDPRRGARKPRRRKQRTAQKRTDIHNRAESVLQQLRELAHDLAHEHGVTRRDAADAMGVLGVQLTVDTATPPGQRVGADDVKALVDALRTHTRETLSAAHAFRQGHVYCFLCDGTECRHAVPAHPDEVFVGYSPTGCPQWQGFVNFLLSRGHEQVDAVYGDRPAVISLAVTGAELTDGLLPGFGQGDLTYNMLGQVVTGLVPRDLRIQGPAVAERVAMCLQLVETRTSKAQRRFRVNLINISRDEILQAAADGASRGPAERLRQVLHNTQGRLNDLGRKVTQGTHDSEWVAARARAIVNSLRGDIDRVFRPVQRRTKHAQQRHVQGARPTSDAMRDVASAGAEHRLWDTRRDTVVVLGRRGRAHVFTLEGRHVTSLRLEPGELERKIERRRWEPLGDERAGVFAAALAG